MISLVPVKCPQCGADLEIEDGRETAFCTYCGAKIIINDENRFTYRHIDDARVKHAETEQMVKMKQMEMAEKKRVDALKTKVLKIKISLALAAIGIILMIVGSKSNSMLSIIGMFPLMGAAYIWILSKKEEDDDYMDFGDKAKIPSSIEGYEKKSYTAIEAMFINAGFTNVTSIPLNDLKVGLIKKPGLVESITINGREVTSGGKKYPKDAPVVISYHSVNK